MNVLVQKDIDGDGNVDKEVSFEEIFSTTSVITFTTEVTQFRFHPRDDEDAIASYGNSTEYRNSTYTLFKPRFSIIFRDLNISCLVLKHQCQRFLRC